MKLLRTKERKAYAGVILTGLMLLVACWSAFGTITITDTGVNSFTISDVQDTRFGMIRTSDGTYFEATNANINTAISSLSNGGTVWLPGNTTISITTSIDVESNINLIGAGASTKLVLGANTALMTISTERNIHIENIFFDVNNDTVTSYVSAIDITGATSNVTIRDCWFVDGEKSFIDCQEGTKYITVSDCSFKRIQNTLNVYPAAVWLSGESCIVKNCYIEDTWANGVVIEAASDQPSSKYHIIDGNEITGNVAHGVHMEGCGAGGQQYPKASNCTIVNNYIHDLNSTCYMDNTPSSNDWSMGILVTENSTCSNNRIENVDRFGIMASHNNTVVQGNIINTIRRYHGIRVERAARISIVDNVISDVIAGGGGSAIQVDSSCKFIIIRGNKLRDIDDAGMYLSGGIIIVSDNIFENMKDNGIEVIGTVDNISISGNMFYNIDGTYGVYIPSGVPAVVTDNYFYDCVSYAIWVASNYGLVSNNKIVRCGSDGIKINHGTHNHSICGNVIQGCTGDGIELDDCHNSTVMGNHVRECGNGIRESGAANGNTIIGNIAAVTTVGAKTISVYNRAAS